jgi:predicted O-linked N-acetylglucosamine transferase (SPINDLY family)/GT2 family glycosyltransferase
MRNATPKNCAVIVPVYNAFPHAAACLRSVLEHTPPECRILVVDDCSSLGELAAHLPPELLASGRIELTRNRENLGFVRTCNSAISRCAPCDVVLLNSDTLVTSNWLAKLQAAAYSRADVGTVTPLTNNGTLCSIPRPLSDNQIPAPYTLDEFAALVERISARRYPELPTCVGFCTYIKREVIDRVGLLDADGFRDGYGEENDFSCRAQAAGYVDILDDATYVYHRGAQSFQERAGDLIARHGVVLEQKQPGYRQRVRRFIHQNPLRPVHQRIAKALLEEWNDSARLRVLHVLHMPPLTSDAPGERRPGGTEYHVADLVRSVAEVAHWSLHVACDAYYLTAHLPGREQHYTFSFHDLDLQEILDPRLFDIVHLHQGSVFPHERLADALLQHGSYIVSLHDFHLVCPKSTRLIGDERFCAGQECTVDCGYSPHAIRALRSASVRLLENALAVLHFSATMRRQFEEVLPVNCRWKHLPHGVDLSPVSEASAVAGPSRPTAARPLRVAFLGALSAAKGVRLVRQICDHERLPGGVPVEWHLVGFHTREVTFGRQLIRHGEYRREELPERLAAVAPDLVAILSVAPEAYCYALDEALLCGIPVVVTPLGAPAERVAEYGCGWVLDRLDAESFLELLHRIVDDWDGYLALRSRIGELKIRGTRDMAAEYAALYTQARPVDSASPPSARRELLHRLLERPPKPRPLLAATPPLLSAAAAEETSAATAAEHIATGTRHHQDGQTHLAEACYWRALACDPQSPHALHLLGVIARQVNRPDLANHYISRAVAIHPDNAEFHNNLGAVLLALDRPQAAEAAYRRAVSLDPHYFQAHVNLATLLRDHGRLDAAAELYHRAVQISPRAADVHLRLGQVCADLERWSEAATSFRHAVEILPNRTDAFLGLGNAQHQLGELDAAVVSYASALRIQPENVTAYFNLGNAFASQEKWQQADEAYRHCQRLQPDQTLWQVRRATLFPTVFASTAEMDRCQRDMVQRWRRLAERNSRFDLAALGSIGCGPPFNLQFTAADLRPLKKAYADIFRHAFPQEPAARNPRGNRPRLGIVVSRGHEALFLKSMGEVIESLDRELAELVVACPSRGASTLRQAIRRESVEVLPLPAAVDRAADVLRAAQFDVLYYWEVGTDALNYFLPFFRPAPVQCTSWGIQATSGIPAMDYFLSSRLVEPAQAADHYTEKLLLADTLLSRQRRAVLEKPRSRADFGFTPRDHLYVCPQHLGKLHPDFDHLLSEVLDRDSQGNLVLVEDQSGFAARRLRERFHQSLAAVVRRVVFLPRLSRPDYLALVALADVLLDPIHFGGVNSSYDAFSLGKAVVTKPSPFHRGRYTLGCYRSMGIGDCIAQTDRDYVNIALKLGTDAPWRFAVEAKIRAASDMLFDNHRAVGEHERLFAEMIAAAR